MSVLFCATAVIIFVLRDVVPTSYAGAALVYSFQVCEQCDIICIATSSRLHQVIAVSYVVDARPQHNIRGAQYSSEFIESDIMCERRRAGV